MAGPFITSIKYALCRLPGISRGDHILWGLSTLAGRIRREFWRSKTSEICLDFRTRKAGDKIKIGDSICLAVKNHRIQRLVVKLGQNIPQLSRRDFPVATLEAAIRCGLRELAMNGIPSEPKTIDLSYTIGPDDFSPYFARTDITAKVRLTRLGEGEAALNFSYFGGYII